MREGERGGEREDVREGEREGEREANREGEREANRERAHQNPRWRCVEPLLRHMVKSIIMKKKRARLNEIR